ncbi:Signal recognition particle 14 kDa protein [Citrus sinensis]|uniref:Signal recognition particle 14 kDa protein n=1 Tax=Citrus sinensis TaxID=2711 RepID=A0ACB8MCU3_CITSI|nr:Signal recognition particle 14 kDa protein [Citrus sinensis]
MFERNRDKGSVWVTVKRSSMKSKSQKNKMATAGEPVEYRCLIRATDGKKKISTTFGYGELMESLNQEKVVLVIANKVTGIYDFVEKVGAKDHQRFQASYATLLKAHMAALKKRERKDKKKGVDGDRKDGAGSTKKPKRV